MLYRTIQTWSPLQRKAKRWGKDPNCFLHALHVQGALVFLGVDAHLRLPKGAELRLLRETLADFEGLKRTQESGAPGSCQTFLLASLGCNRNECQP